MLVRKFMDPDKVQEHLFFALRVSSTRYLEVKTCVYLNARGNLDTLLTLASAWVNESPEEADVQVCDRILVLRRNNVNRVIRTSDLG